MIRSLTFLLACLPVALAGIATAQPAAPPERNRPAPVEGRRLPADSTTLHTVELPGRTLRVRATAGALTLVNPAGAVTAEIAFTAYRLEGADAATRPVTFAVNGGPGASSAFLHLLLAGPWRLPVGETSISPSAPIAVVPNAETWLDFTDLVFLDPVGTGYSRAAGSGEEVRDSFYSVDGDIGSLAAAVSRWLRENDRLVSPKFLMGESYGGFRMPLLAERLALDTGTGPSGLILVSPVLDFAWLSEPRWKPMELATQLPSLVAATRSRRGPVARADLAEAERYASGDYVVDLLRGPGDREAVDRMTERLAALTGLDPAFIRRQDGKIAREEFQKELRRPEGLTVSAYDTGVTGFDPDPGTADIEGSDPGLYPLLAPLGGASVDLLARRLNWRVPNARYEVLNGGVSGQWRYARGRRSPESLTALRGALARDGKLRVMVVHGLTDLVTPYFASELLLRQIPAFGGRRRADLLTYPGGHMFYTRDASRAAFRADALTFYETALRARAGE